MLLESFNIIALLATLVLSGFSLYFITMFTIEIIKDANKKNIDHTLCFLFANLSLFVMIGIIIKQMWKGL